VYLVGFHYKNDVLRIACNNNVTAYFEVASKIFMDKLNRKKVSESKFGSLVFRIRSINSSQYTAVHGYFVLLLCIVVLQFSSISSLTGIPKNTRYTNKLVCLLLSHCIATVLFIMPSLCGSRVVNYI
jgi:hypothetical protein